MLRTISDLDYEPEVVDEPTEKTVLADRIDATSLPEKLTSLFAEARATNKPVLIEFTGPG